MAKTNANKTERFAKERLIAALDVGSTKICCLIAQIDSSSRIEILGVAHQASKGVRAGTIVDLGTASDVIGDVVEQAETNAKRTIEQILVNLGDETISSFIANNQISIAGQPIDDTHIHQLFHQCWEQRITTNTTFLHAIPLTYEIDNNCRILDPYGMKSETLAVRMNLVTATSSSISNLTTCLGYYRLNVEHIVTSAYASGLATLAADELAHGAICIDIGGETTNIAIFYDNRIMFTATIALGGNNITRDLMQGLNTSFENAERLKIKFGNAIGITDDNYEMIEIDDNPNNVKSRSEVIEVITVRCQQILRDIHVHLKQFGLTEQDQDSFIVVLTGGTSHLPGFQELAKQELHDLIKHVRIGWPIDGALPNNIKGPEFATLVGLLYYPNHDLKEIIIPEQQMNFFKSLWRRMRKSLQRSP